MTEQDTEDTEDTDFESPYNEENADDALAESKFTPANISGDAHKALARRLREWSGWSDAHLEFRDPKEEGIALSPYAVTMMDTHSFLVNLDPLVLNPNRVIKTLTPFRLRQEAVLTGVLLHEAGHARHTCWPRGEAFKHSDGQAPTKATISLARLMEESRVEGRIAEEETRIGAYGLSWTMQAAAAHLLPMTKVSEDPNQALMDLIGSWAKRACRQIAFYKRTHRPLKSWVGDFNALLGEAIEAHLASLPSPPVNVLSTRQHVINVLIDMALSDDDTGVGMIDDAREVLDILFKGMPPEDQPSAGDGCSAGASPSTGEADSDEKEDEQDDGQSNQGEKPEWAAPLEKIEEKADGDVKAEGQAEAQSQPEPPDSDQSGRAAGDGAGRRSAEWRTPTREEREVQRRAEAFLRSIVDPSEGSKVTLSAAPSSIVDGAALAAWKAGGKIREPRFFVRTRREAQPKPPVKIAILVDISSSMAVLQKPSALLSWALASAAFDLRNFAGRGQQIESCLIHWGTKATVIQEVGKMLPGIREVNCNEGTTAMGQALRLVEEQIPDFFDAENESNRLLVQFTDWELWGSGDEIPILQRALEVGVNMLCVTPQNYSGLYSKLSGITTGVPFAKGKTSLIHYNPVVPGAVWDSATELLK